MLFVRACVELANAVAARQISLSNVCCRLGAHATQQMTQQHSTANLGERARRSRVCRVQTYSLAWREVAQGRQTLMCREQGDDGVHAHVKRFHFVVELREANEKWGLGGLHESSVRVIGVL